MNHRRRKVLLAAEQGPRFFQLQKVSAQADLGEHVSRKGRERSFEAAAQTHGGGNRRGIDHQLLQAMTRQRIEHARA